MTRARTLLSALAVCGIAAVAVAGCGSSNDSSSTSSTAASTPSTTASGGGAAVKPATGPATIEVTNNSDLGKILTNAEGFTMYLFEADSGGKSSCYGQCAVVWPPLTTKGQPKMIKGADSKLLGTTKRKDGTEQVTYNNWPLYGYKGDSKPGDTNGNDFTQFGAQWYALTPAGKQASD